MPVDADPETDRVLADLELSRSLAIQLSVVGTLGFVVALAAFGGLYQVGTGRPAAFEFGLGGVDWWNGAANLLAIVALTMAVVVPHEGCHGLAIRYFGGTPRYGVGVAHFVLPYAYATTDHRFTRNQFVAVLLAPLVGLTLIGVPAMIAFEWGWLVLPLAANAAGAVGDLWMVLTLLGYPSRVTVEDRRSGFRVLGEAGDRVRDLSVTTAVWDALVGTAAATVVVLLGLGVAGPFVLSALDVGSLAVGEPGTFTFLFAFSETATELSLAVGSGVLVAGALVGLVYAAVRTYGRSRAPPSGPTD